MFLPLAAFQKRSQATALNNLAESAVASEKPDVILNRVVMRDSVMECGGLAPLFPAFYWFFCDLGITAKLIKRRFLRVKEEGKSISLSAVA